MSIHSSDDEPIFKIPEAMPLFDMRLIKGKEEESALRKKGF